jgi:endonuclease-3
MPSRIMPKNEVRPFIEALAQARPDAETELVFSDAYTLLVAVVLSAQATDASVNRATAGLFRAAPDPAAMVELGVERVAQHIRSIGLWQGKAKNVVALSEILLRDHAGQVPRERAALEALPGVGRKTANVVLNVAFGESTMAVDTHIFRLGNRTGLAPGKTPRQVEDGLLARVPRVQGTPAGMFPLRGGAMVPLSGQNAGRGGARPRHRLIDAAGHFCPRNIFLNPERWRFNARWVPG